MHLCVMAQRCLSVPVRDGTQMFDQQVPALCPGPAQAGSCASREQETNPKKTSFLWLQDKVWGWHSQSCPVPLGSVSLQRNLFSWRGQSRYLSMPLNKGFYLKKKINLKKIFKFGWSSKTPGPLQKGDSLPLASSNLCPQAVSEEGGPGPTL